MTESEFRAELLGRLSRVEAMLERLCGDCEPALLRAIGRVFGNKAFVAGEVSAAADGDVRLRAAIGASIGFASCSRRLGWLLSRSAGKNIGGLTVERLGDCDRGAIWRVSTKPIAALAKGDERGQDRGS